MNDSRLSAGKVLEETPRLRPWDEGPRLIAFYLPQYHPIPENDRWWGKGFTEWTNVAKARPLFRGHYQPHLPADLGFYDLRLPEVRQAQADLAREYGIGGFCYYHYWFNGKRLLERPFQEVLESGKPDFPFCLCWANENWTRAWDGLEKEVLLKQEYSADDDRRHVRALVPAFMDSRYIRVEGKPLFLIYRASNLPEPLRTTSVLREEARRQGVGELYLCRVESHPRDRQDPRPQGFDAGVEFAPDWLRLPDPIRGNVVQRWGSRLGLCDVPFAPPGVTVYDYSQVASSMLSKTAVAYPRFRCVTPGWDNSPRRKQKVAVLYRSTPQQYEQWLQQVLSEAVRQAHPSLVFINAWNEWGEGAHLEPDQCFGHQYLEATRRAVTAGANRS